MKFRKEQTEELSVNLTPLIDVVFLLLIFFMVSTTFEKKTQLDISLAKASGQPVATETKKIEILINANGEYFINEAPVAGQSFDELKDALEAVVPDNRDIPFIIMADRETNHEMVMRAMDVAKQLGFVKISLGAQKRQ